MRRYKGEQTNQGAEKWFVVNGEQTNHDIEEWLAVNREQMIGDIITLVNIKSVKGRKEGRYTFGAGVARALEQALSMAAKAGFETCNDNYYYGLVRLPGRTTEKLGIFVHLDVVPEGTGWEYEPYQAVVEDGYIIGRGAGDNKGPAMAALYAMKYLKERNITLNKTIELYLGCAEEEGMEDIAYYVKRNIMPGFSFTPDVAFPVSYAEKGILEVKVQAAIEKETCLTHLQGGQAANMVAPEASAMLKNPTDQTISLLKAQKNISVIRQGERILVKARGIGKHAAFPEGSENAIKILAGALAEAEQLEANTRRALSFIAGTLADYYGASLRIPYEDTITGKLTHTCGVIRKNGDNLEVDYNIRYPVETPVEELKKRLQERFEKEQFCIIKLHDNPPMYMPSESITVRKLTDICNENLGTDLKPYTMGGGTYARKLPNAVGFGPGRNDIMSKWGNGHEANEGVKIENLENAVKIYIKAMMELDNIIWKKEV